MTPPLDRYAMLEPFLPEVRQLPNSVHYDPDFVNATMLQGFREFVQSSQARLTGALDPLDLDTIGRVMHSMKGTAPVLGFPEIAAMAILMEEEIHERNGERIPAMTQAFQAWCQWLEQADLDPGDNESPPAS